MPCNPPRDSTPNPTRDASLDPYLGFHPDPSSPEGRENRRPPFPPERIPREPPVNWLSRHILAKAPVFHAPVDSGSAPVSVICFLYQWRACCKSAGCVQALWMPFSPYWPQREGRTPVGCDWES